MRWPALLLVCLCLASCMAMSSSPGRTPASTSALPTRHWAPHGPPRSTILTVHGFNDYKRSFEGFGAYAAARGHLVIGYDQRGFGANEDAGLWPGTETLVDDLRARIQDLHARHPERPLHLLAASMGAAVATVALARHPELPVDRVILSSPAVWGGDALNPLYRLALRVAAFVAPGLELTGRRLDVRASDNDEALRLLFEDPLVIKSTRLDAIEGLVSVMDRAHQLAPALESPMLVLVGAKDEIVPPEVQIAFARRLETSPCSLVVYPDGWHMLLRDLKRHIVWADIVDWLEGGEPAPERRAPCRGPLAAS